MDISKACFPREKKPETKGQNTYTKRSLPGVGGGPNSHEYFQVYRSEGWPGDTQRFYLLQVNLHTFTKGAHVGTPYL